MLNRSVRDLIERDTLVSAPFDATVLAATKAMAEHVCGSILVTEGKCLVGIFTTHDLLMRVTAAGRDPDVTCLGEVMTCDPVTLPADAPIKTAIRLLEEVGHRCYLPVIEGGHVIGILSTHCLLSARLPTFGAQVGRSPGAVSARLAPSTRPEPGAQPRPRSRRRDGARLGGPGQRSRGGGYPLRASDAARAS